MESVMLAIPAVWLYFAAGFATAAVLAAIGWGLASRAREQAYHEALTRLKNEQEAQNRAAEEGRNALVADNRSLQEALQNARLESTRLTERVQALQTRLETQEAQYRRQIEELQTKEATLEQKAEEARERISQLESDKTELTTRLEEERRSFEARLSELKEAKETMQKEFKILAARIMEENSRRFSQTSKEGVEALLKPLQQQMGEFKKRIEEVHTEETKSVTTLLSEIRHLKELNLKISEEAVSLTRALRGESKTRGIWGEMVLERVLEASGLRKGEEYEREVSLKDTDARRYRPDVIVHLPDKRDIVIDAKAPLSAYERYINAEEEADRERYAREHLTAVQAHIDSLAGKDYTRLEGIESLDFVFLFIPVEGALMLALETDNRLYDRAFEKRIVLVSPTTLLVALRAVENTWRRDRQSKNALEIAKKAGDLYDKFVGFAEDMERIGRQLETLQKSYDNAWKKLTDGRGNLIRRIEELRELGAKASKQMPERIARESESMAPNDAADDRNKKNKSQIP